MDLIKIIIIILIIISICLSLYKIFYKQNNDPCKKCDKCNKDKICKSLISQYEEEIEHLNKQIHSCDENETDKQQKIDSLNSQITTLQKYIKDKCKCSGSPPTPPPPPPPPPVSGEGPFDVPTLTGAQKGLGNIFVDDVTNLDSSKNNTLTLPILTMSNGSIPATTLLTKDNTLSNLKMGYYTSVIGIGNIKNLTINGGIDIRNNIGSEDNVFFKSLYNLNLTQNQGFNLTSSQMCPFRLCNFNKSVALSLNGYASGGYMADCNITGDINFAQSKNGTDKSAQQFCAKNITCSGQVILGQKNFVFVDSNIKGGSVKGTTARNPNFVNIKTGKLSNNNTFTTYKYPPIETYLKDVLNGDISKYIIITKSTELSNLSSSNIKSGSIILIMPNLYRDYSKSSNIVINTNNVQIIGIGFPVLIGYTFDIKGNSCTLASIILDAKPLRFKQPFCINIDGDNNKIFDVTTRTIIGPGPPNSIYEDNAGVDKMFIINGKDNYLENFWAWRGDHWTCYINENNKPYPTLEHNGGITPKPKPEPKPSDLSLCIKKSCDYGRPKEGWPSGRGPDAMINYYQHKSGDFNNCGAQCNNNSECKYFKQKGTWCGLYSEKEGDVIAPADFADWKKYSCYTDNNDLNSGISNNVKDANCNWISSGGGGGGGGSGSNKNYYGSSCGGGDNSYGFNKPIYDDDNYNPIGIHITKDANNCQILGSFVEHQNLYNILWEGNNGIHIFNQGELAYTNFGKTKHSLINNIKASYLIISGDNYYANGLGIYNIGTASLFPAINIQNTKNCNSSNINLNNIILSSWFHGYGGLAVQYNTKKSSNIATNNSPTATRINNIGDFCKLLN